MSAKDVMNEKGFMGTTSHFKDLGSFLDDSFYILLSAVGTVLLGVGGAFVGNWKLAENIALLNESWWHIVPFVLNPFVMLIVGGILIFLGPRGAYRDQAKQQNRISELEGKLRDANQKMTGLEDCGRHDKSSINDGLEQIEFLNGRLRELHADLVTNQLIAMQQLFDFTTEDRITVYYEYRDEFYLLARHSLNPAYNKIHRQKFPVNQGVIGFAWHNQEFFENSCPSFGDSEAYYAYVTAKHNMDAASVNGLTMKSCRYLAFAIRDAGKHVGVVVFESVNEKFFDARKSQIDQIIRHYFAGNKDMFAKYVRDGLVFNRDQKVIASSRKGVAEADILFQFEGGVK